MSAFGGPAPPGEPGKMSEEDLRLLRDIEEKVVDNLNLGFDPRVLEVLDDETAGAQRIEELKNSLDKAIATRMFGMANSLYYGKLHAGEVSGFFEVILRLGMQPAKAFILVHSIFSLSTAREMRVLSARSFGTLVLARMLAAEMGLKGRELEQVELGSLFREIGRVLMFLYQSRGGERLEEGFVDRYHPYLGMRMWRNSSCPNFLWTCSAPRT
jgi:HD-like signal output (HDOD) protein